MNDDWTSAVDGLEEALAALPRANPNAARAHRVRLACHLELTRHRRERVAKAGGLESALVGGFCAVYFSLLMLLALRTHGLL